MNLSVRNMMLLAATSKSANAFFVSSPSMQLRIPTRCPTKTIAIKPNKALKMSDFDFPSAMPEKPVQTMEEQLRDSATSFIADITARLGKGVDPPPELEALKKVRDDEGSDVQTLSLKIYELMIGEYFVF
jgi:hypothetical protein